MSVDFDLTDLRLFLHVLETGSITAGARAAHLSLAAGSARVLGMEQALTTPLLTRGRRGVLPTAAGLALVQHARTVLQQAEQLRLDLEEHARSRKHHIALIGTSAAIREYLPDALGDFLAQHPLVNVSVAEAASEESVQAVLVGSADIAFVTERPAIQGLEFYPFVVNRFALVVPRGHPLVQDACGRVISEALADGCDVVGLPEGSALQDTWEARAAGRGAALNYRVRVPGFDAQLRLIERGVGVAILPEDTAQRGARTMAIEVLTLSDPYLLRRLLICVQRLSALPPYTQSLIEQLCTAHRASLAGAGQTDRPGTA
ncbi:MAG: LysR family transcriptional regulator [Burkholderiales bacterium]|jgi:DNA-binding transcriptional LysR family regulator|nr:LysR family transcriptional regulator [Burkholderiales bacterium]